MKAHLQAKLLAVLLLAGCNGRPTAVLPPGAENARISMEARSNGFKLTASAGFFKFINRKDQRVVYHASPELIFTPSGQVAAAADNSLALDPSLVVSSPQKSTVLVCPDGIVTIRGESGKQTKIGRLLLSWFDHPDKLKSAENGFLEATPEAGEPLSFAPVSDGQCG